MGHSTPDQLMVALRQPAEALSSHPGQAPPYGRRKHPPPGAKTSPKSGAGVGLGPGRGQAGKALSPARLAACCSAGPPEEKRTTVNTTAGRGGRNQDPPSSQPRFLAWFAARARQPEVPPEYQPGITCVRHGVPSPRGIFISYRRNDTGPYARLLKDHLSSRFPATRVFMDLDSIEAGLDFEEVIDDALNSCLVMVALIGPKWATATDEEGRRRIDDPGDLVRFEIRTAFERGVRVIPVLPDGARPLHRQQLPADLHKLARLNALEMSYDRFDYDESRLTAIIAKALAAPQTFAGAIPSE